MIGLGIVDQVSSVVVAGSPHTFWATVAHAWGTSGFGGFGSSALAMLIALIEVFAAMFVWLELSRDWVYAHAEELGEQRIGDGPRGRLRVDLDRALTAWTSCSHGESGPTLT